MQADNEECLSLVDEMEIEYKGRDIYTFVNTVPDKIFQTDNMGLWAQTISGETKINLGLPSIRAWLKRLAENGPGPFEEYYGVKYRFVKRELRRLS